MKKIFIIILLLLLIPQIIFSKDNIIFYECVDGDTFKLKVNNVIKTYRLLAVDTPETVKPNTPIQPYGMEASKYTCNKLKSAKIIKVEHDQKAKKDKYNRDLIWLWLDNKLLNKELVEIGYAKVAYIYADYKYIREIKEAEIDAKLKEVGIWSKKEYKVDKDYTNYIIIVVIILLLILSLFISNKNINKIIKILLKKVK